MIPVTLRDLLRTMTFLVLLAGLWWNAPARAASPWGANYFPNVPLRTQDNKPVKFFGAQATGCSPISTAVKTGAPEIEPQRPNTIARSLAIGNPADGHYAIRAINGSGGYAEDISDSEVVDNIQLLAETEGIFTETAGGVTVGCARKLYEQGRIAPDETTVLCITGNGLKTTDALAGRYSVEEPIAPKISVVDRYLEEEWEQIPA